MVGRAVFSPAAAPSPMSRTYACDYRTAYVMQHCLAPDLEAQVAGKLTRRGVEKAWPMLAPEGVRTGALASALDARTVSGSDRVLVVEHRPPSEAFPNGGALVLGPSFGLPAETPEPAQRAHKYGGSDLELTMRTSRRTYHNRKQGVAVVDHTAAPPRPKSSAGTSSAVYSTRAAPPSSIRASTADGVRCRTAQASIPLRPYSRGAQTPRRRYHPQDITDDIFAPGLGPHEMINRDYIHISDGWR